MAAAVFIGALVMFYGLAGMRLAAFPAEASTADRADPASSASAPALATPALPAPSLSTADRDLLRRQKLALTEERGKLRGLADLAVETTTRIEFGHMRLRVPTYADWAYGWTSSYVASYQIIYRAFQGAWAHLMSDQPGSVLVAMTNEAADVVRARFREIVVRPDRTQVTIDREWRQTRELIDSELQRVQKAQALVLRDLPPAGALGPAARVLPPRESGLGAVLEAETPDIDAVLLRSTRPMATRVGILALRLTEVGSVAALVGSLGFSLGPVSGVAVGIVVGVGIAWGIDYLINRLDAALHRAEFEQQGLELVAALENDTRSLMLADLVERIEQGIARLEDELAARSLDLGPAR
jgi:hypothetical protein